MVYYIKELENGKKVISFKGEGFVTFFNEDPANTDYQAYLKWLEEGNTPQPADE